MKKCNAIKYIVFLVAFLFFSAIPTVYAEDLVKCKYEIDSGMTMYNFTLSKSGENYSTAGSLKKFNDQSQSEHFPVTNLNDWIGAFSKKDKKEMCPSYLVLVKKDKKRIVPNNPFSVDLGTTWEAYAFESEGDAQNKSSAIQGESGTTTDADGTQIITTVAAVKNLHSTNRSTYAKEHGHSSDDTTIDMGKDISTNTCEEVLGESVVEFIQMIFNYIKILGPILVILFSSIDFTRSILSSDEENMKKTQKRFGIRILCAIGLYFLPLLATFIINLVFGTSGSQVCGLR